MKKYRFVLMSKDATVISRTFNQLVDGQNYFDVIPHSFGGNCNVFLQEYDSFDGWLTVERAVFGPAQQHDKENP